jgi:hypothetical protein
MSTDPHKSRPNAHGLPILFRDRRCAEAIVLLKLSHIRMCLLPNTAAHSVRSLASFGREQAE